MNKKYILLALLAATISSVALAANEKSASQIYNVRYGLADFNKRQIYQEANHVQYRENGMCTSAGKKEPCLQWAIQYSYRDMKVGTKMACTTHTSEPTHFTDIYHTSPDLTGDAPVEITFTKESGVTFLPGYVIREPEGHGKFAQHFRCEIAGTEVLNVDFVVDME